LQFASGLHHAQIRKGTNIPYLAHLLAVCALVLEAGGDEDQAIMALLHDAVECQGGLSTLDSIRRLFGDWVADAIESLSDSTEGRPHAKSTVAREKRKISGASAERERGRAARRHCRQVAQCQSNPV
jgi:(p)ppGpp synthase/HD superfamily hydrolase